jgi:hypothetical protein
MSFLHAAMDQIIKKVQIFLVLAISTTLATSQTSSPSERNTSDFDVFDYIDPFIGTVTGGRKKSPSFMTQTTES